MRFEPTRALAVLLAVAACGTNDRVLTDNVVDPRALFALTKFRSCCGHSYSGWGEPDRSMKHYLVPAPSSMGTNDTVPVYAPCDGELVSITAEQSYAGCSAGEVRGYNVRFVCRARPDVSVRIFHVNPSRGPGAVRSGAHVGYADLRGCAQNPGDLPYADFDVAVEKLGAFYSYIEWLDDGAFAAWAARGLASRDDAFVSRSARDADPCGSRFGQCEEDTILFPSVTPPSAIAAGAYHTCAVVNGGALCWGDGLAGQTGNGGTNGDGGWAPMPVVGLTSGVQAIAAGEAHTCAIVSGGAQCWGSTTSSSVPVQVSGLTSGVSAIAAGREYSCAVVSGGAQCWGAGGAGQLGNGSYAGSSVPVAVVGLGSAVQAIAAGGSHACALVDGGVQCWGAGGAGQLGDGSYAGSSVPVAVSGLGSGVQAIAAGGSHACAVVGGGARCWGDNTSGQLGDGSTTSSSVPVGVVGLESGVQAIAAGAYHTCAVVNDGVQCWGRGRYAELGDGTAADSSTPVHVFGLTAGGTAVTAGQEHTCALVNRGAECWGNGRLGSLTRASSTIPVPVFGLAP